MEGLRASCVSEVEVRAPRGLRASGLYQLVLVQAALGKRGPLPGVADVREAADAIAHPPLVQSRDDVGEVHHLTLDERRCVRPGR